MRKRAAEAEVAEAGGAAPAPAPETVDGADDGDDFDLMDKQVVIVDLEGIGMSALRCLYVFKVWWCRLTPCSPRVDCTWFQLLKLIFDRQIANFACNFNLRRYIKVINSVASFNYPELSKAIYILNSPSVRRCRLTPG